MQLASCNTISQATAIRFGELFNNRNFILIGQAISPFCTSSSRLMGIIIANNAWYSVFYTTIFYNLYSGKLFLNYKNENRYIATSSESLAI